ncbi:sugar ABC transporter ATP-binding protein [Treponema sp. TIM-1]|uniref:sugar ABC transporter ATP-binding protein n=1 Tax=Treponema sp. TIM-1 TaxID=2898417 RepID=UPI0039810D48
MKLNGISKAFYGNYALNNVSLTLNAGKVHCIAGENGAGKSTLIKILTGAYRPDSGAISFGNRQYRHLTPRISAEAGIVAVYQENVLAEQLTVAENIFAAREPAGPLGLVSFRKMEQDTAALLGKYGIDLPSTRLVSQLTLAQKQYVKILRAISMKPCILIFDEPTAMLNIKDVQKVLELVSRFRAEGASIVYISHQLSEVLEIADEITVLRDGIVVSTRNNKDKDITPQMLTADMVGRPMELLYKRGKTFSSPEPVLRAEKIKIEGYNEENSFQINRGEIVVITGMVGSGRTELLEGIFGCRKKTGGSLYFYEQEHFADTPESSIRKGIGYITEDRQKSGLALVLDVAENITCVALNLFRGFTIFPRKETETARKAAESNRVKYESVRQPVRQLSGGNQQKVLLSRWMLRGFDMILLDEPTKGVDINAKYEIYALIEELSSRGKSFLIVSSDMSEVISISDRVLIMRKGKICGELKSEEINEKNIIHHALGVTGT